MKKIMVGLGLAMALAGTAAAQHPGNGRGGRDGLLLKGIELTEGQRTQIAQLRKTQRDAMEAKREQGKKELESMRDARRRGDTAAVRAQMVKLSQAREQERAQRVAAIREVLTAEQRIQFDKNVAELKQREAERAQKVGQRGKRGPHGQKTGHAARGFGRGR